MVKDKSLDIVTQAYASTVIEGTSGVLQEPKKDPYTSEISTDNENNSLDNSKVFGKEVNGKSDK